ncbi:MAG: acyltransferase family protein [Bdellovibrionales bacterium]
MKLPYRPEIDGLRAVAVISVILYHAQLTLFGYKAFAGGFIGVDVFFVISGYLITSLILREVSTTGGFSFLKFYERRARRILPALFTVMLVSFPLAWKYLIPASFMDFSKSILYSLGFGSNWYFHYTGLRYGEAGGITKPFLHTWSLSVEEQYYLLFPVLALIAYKYCRKYFLTILLVGILISLAASDWGARNHPSATFYFLHTRVWELLIGSALASFEFSKGGGSAHPFLNKTMPALGILLIAYAILMFQDGMLHPSVSTLTPVLGVALIIRFAHQNEFITKILSSKLLVGIGLISYSLYLWHYPIFSFGHISGISIRNEYATWYFMVATVLLSVATYFLVEKPFRQSRIIGPRVLTASLAALLTIIAWLNTSVLLNSGFNSVTRLPDVLFRNIDQNNIDLRLSLKDPSGKPCHNNIHGCHFLRSQEWKHLFLLGDSHFAMLDRPLYERTKTLNLNYHSFTIGGCFFIPDFHRVSYTNPNDKCEFCNETMQSNILNELAKYKDSIIVVGGRLQLFLTREYFDNEEGGIENTGRHPEFKSSKNLDLKSHFKATIEALARNNHVILVYPIPEVGFDVPTVLMNHIKAKPKELSIPEFLRVQPISTSFDVFRRRTQEVFALYDSIVGERISRIYPHKLFCGDPLKDRCVVHNETDFFYFDDDHPSIKGAEMIIDLIAKTIDKAAVVRP